MADFGHIYKLTCQITGKSYVGQTRESIQKRWRGHVKSARVPSATHRSTYLMNAVRRHGEEQFIVECLETCPVEQLNAREQHWIATLGTLAPGGYNLEVGGRASPVHPASRSKIAQKLRGRKFSPETLQKMRQAAARRHVLYPNSYRAAATKHAAKGRAVIAVSAEGTSHWFRSVSHAVRCGFGKTGIRMCLSGHQRTHKQLTWVWADAWLS